MPLCIAKPVMLSLGLGFETRFFGLCLGLSLAFLVFLLSLVVLLLLLRVARRPIFDWTIRFFGTRSG